MKTPVHRAPALIVSLALFAAAALPLAAQLTPQQDPANLAGERVSPQDPADTLPFNHGAVALQQLLRKLRTRASFMLIVAHPDDEDNGALTYLSRGQGARVATFTLNRGEGGQNLMSADFDDALGLIRTQELLAADRYMDVDQMFGTEVDFGFSKTKEEAFSKWTHERVLYDVVRAIRLYRPLVIASVFIGEPSDGHGQHQVSGEIAQEAFKAAGDPSVFPDQIAAGLQPWQPLKVYARSPFGRIDAQGMYDYATTQYVPARFENYVTGKVTNTVPKANVVVPEGDTDPLFGGVSYAQLGRTGRALQKSQIGGGGGGGAGPGGRADVSYHRYGSALNQPDGDDSGLESGFFDGIDTSIKGIASLAPDAPRDLAFRLDLLQQQIENVTRLSAAPPGSFAPLLADATRSLDDLISNVATMKIPERQRFDVLHELHIKRVQLNDALVLALGVSVTTRLKTDHQIDCVKAILPGCIAEIDTNFTNGAIAPVRVLSDFTSYTGTSDAESTFAPSTAVLQPGERIMPDRAVIEERWPPRNVVVLNSTKADPFALKQAEGRPYFSRPDVEQPFYDLQAPALRLAPMTPVQSFWTRFSYSGISLLTGCYITAVAEPGESPIPLRLEPSFSISFNPTVKITPKDVSPLVLRADVRNNGTAPASADVNLELPKGWSAAGATKGVAAIKPREFNSVSFEVRESSVTKPPYLFSASVDYDDQAPVTESFRSVGYSGLTPTPYYTPATLRVVPVDVTTAPNLNIAYIPGTGDDVAADLEQLGVHPHILTTANLTVESLKPYDAVILGVRAYQRRELAAANAALNAYAAAGGIVIAQYNTGRLPDATGPYPLDLGGSQNVVEENAPVKILAPDNPLLTWPNKITTADFDHWVEERGHGFMATWDPHYTPLLETADHGQQPQQGGLLVARTGRGAWIYLGLAVYRQLPEGVPGAYRLIANLISTAKNPAFTASAVSMH